VAAFMSLTKPISDLRHAKANWLFTAQTFRRG
jgi:hypothetical protein